MNTTFDAFQTHPLTVYLAYLRRATIMGGGTPEQYDAVHDLVGRIESHSRDLERGYAVVSSSHLQRTKEYNTRLSKKVGNVDRGRPRGGESRRKKSRQQGSLDGYFKKKTDVFVDGHGDDDEDDGEGSQDDACFAFSQDSEC